MKKKNISGFGSIYYKGKKLNFTGPVTTGAYLYIWVNGYETAKAYVLEKWLLVLE